MLNLRKGFIIQKPDLLGSLSVLLIILSISTRFFGLPRPFFYIFFFGLFTSLILIIPSSKFIIPKDLPIIASATLSLSLLGVLNFYFEIESEFSQIVLMLLAILRIFCSIMILYIINNYSKNYSWLSVLNNVIKLAILIGVFQWLVCSLGLSNIASILQPGYRIIGSFPIYRVNGLFPESQHFGSALVVYLFSNYILSRTIKDDKYFFNNEFKISMEARKEYSSIFYKLGVFLVILGGSTTSYVLIIILSTYILLKNILNKYLKNPIKSLNRLINLLIPSSKLYYKNLLIFISIFIFFIYSFVFSGDRINQFTGKQIARVQMLGRLILLSDEIIDTRFDGTRSRRARSFEKAVNYLKDPTIELPKYQADSIEIYTDGLLFNFIRFGFLGAIFLMISFLIPLFAQTTYVGILMFSSILILYWGKGVTYPSPDICIFYIYSYFVNLTLFKKQSN